MCYWGKRRGLGHVGGHGGVAALVQPLREHLQRGVTHLVSGQCDELYAVVAQLGERMEATLAPEQVLPTLVRTLVAALRLPYVAVALGIDAEAWEVIEHGIRPTEVQALPLVHHGEPVGELRYGARAAQEAPAKAERNLLLTLAQQASVAVAAVRLQPELRAARERLGAAREEERRHLRRDLHDGLGSQLASLALQLDTARLLLLEDTPASPVLGHAKRQAQETVNDVRRIDLRPPALDELRLLGAVHEWLRPHAEHLTVTLGAPDELPALPAVEVAALRIVGCAQRPQARPRHLRARHPQRRGGPGTHGE
ncbi:histidine kinase [Deinococcus oregonensis]|uniref:histidine kinase n=1 Tax=Deinococcus oregonensis TaxID=1805970 RepID=A0ABV6B957_9DEIO